MDISKLPPKYLTAIVITLILAVVLMEATKSDNTATLIALLIGTIGLQQAQVRKTTDRIEHQTNGMMTQRHAETKEEMAEIRAMLQQHLSDIQLQIERIERRDTPEEAES